MTTQHKNITDADLHEPKGVVSAGVNTVYTSDGLGSGTWSLPVYTITADIDDVSTVGSYWVAIPYAGTITKIYSVLHSAITIADANLSFEILGVPITSGGIIIAYSGSAAGDIDSSTPSAANTVTSGSALELITDGASTTAAKVSVTFVIQRV